MTLQFLHFDTSEADDESGSFDTMASASPARLAALQAEVVLVLAWAHRSFPGQRGPLDEGGTWDYDLQATQERSRQELLQYDPATGRLTGTPAGTESLRHTLSLTVSGNARFCAAFQARFAPADD